MTSICIDGFNISLQRGTGIATYGRTLLNTIQDLGLQTQVLYGPPTASPRKNALLQEVALADAERKLPRIRRSVRAIRTLPNPWGRIARPVKPTGEVIWPADNRSQPSAESYWSADNLFYYANRSFKSYGTITTVSFAGSKESPAPAAMHWTATLPLRARGTFNIHTIHDLVPLRLPHSTTEDKKSYYDLCQSIVRNADHIITVSETTKSDIIRIFSADPARISNTYQTISASNSEKTRSDDNVANELDFYFQLRWKDYFLFYGAIEPKKNVGRLVEAYLSSGTSKPLVIVGGRSWLGEYETSFLNQVKRDDSRAGRQIRQIDYLPQAILKSIVRGARATLFPSLYEGFGLPVIESMAQGTATLTSTEGSMPEIAGDASLLVNPYDVTAIAKGIQTLDVDDDFRDDLVSRGLRRSQYFSQDAYRRRLANAYAEAGLFSGTDDASPIRL